MAPTSLPPSVHPFADGWDEAVFHCVRYGPIRFLVDGQGVGAFFPGLEVQDVASQRHSYDSLDHVRIEFKLLK